MSDFSWKFYGRVETRVQVLQLGIKEPSIHERTTGLMSGLLGVSCETFGCRVAHHQTVLFDPNRYVTS